MRLQSLMLQCLVPVTCPNHEINTNFCISSDPPLEENDIPAGSWLCRECKAGDEKQGVVRSIRVLSPTEKTDGEKKSRYIYTYLFIK